MSKEKFIEIICMCFFIFIFGTIFILLPFILVRGHYIDIGHDDLCKYHYGTDYVYIHDEYFGTYCIELIHENITMQNPKPYNWTFKEVSVICGRPNDFDLTKWDSERCHGEYAFGRRK